jgi:hypothetical protein
MAFDSPDRLMAFYDELLPMAWVVVGKNNLRPRQRPRNG